MAAEVLARAGRPAEELPAICLVGPTGTGKTELALRVAEEFDVEIVSVDSAMVYCRMDIGTAKPPAEVRARIPHHLVDVREPWEAYSAGEFRADAAGLIAGIRGRGRVPLLVGGTMLYFRALARGLASLPPADEAMRAQIDAEARERGWPALHAELAVADPGAAERIAPRDRQRIQRALEVLRLTGRRISDLQQEMQQCGESGFRRIALVPADRRALYRNLDDRLTRMIGSGFVEEVRGLMALPLMSAQRPSMRAVGYRQIWSYLAGEMTCAEAQAEAAKATRHLAKRQLTWLRSDPADLTLDPLAHGAYGRLSDFLAAAGVSRRAMRCNMIDGPIECREHGV